LQRGFLRHRRLQPARAEAERQELRDARGALANEIEARDPTVDDSVLDVLGDVGGADEQYLDRRVPTSEREGALARLLGAEPGVLEQPESRLA
jgi:hypothetical protein